MPLHQSRVDIFDKEKLLDLHLIKNLPALKDIKNLYIEALIDALGFEFFNSASQLKVSGKTLEVRLREIDFVQ